VTILGFAMAGMLYYLGRFDDKRKEYIRLWLEFAKVEIKSTSEIKKSFEILMDVLYKSKTPIHSVFFHISKKEKEEMEQRIDSIKAHTPEAMKLYGLSDQVLSHIKFIATYMGVAIIASFYGLFILSNLKDQTTWPAFVWAITSMGIATNYFANQWKHMRQFSEIIDNNSMTFERRINEHNSLRKVGQ
jgi:hypothetical protein